MSNGTSPTCPVSYGQPRITSQPAGVDIATVPPARDLKSAITALNQISHIVQHITRGQPQINNTYVPVVNVATPLSEKLPPPSYLPVTWKETSRNYKQQEAINPDDDDQRVAIKTLSKVVWTEDVTEHTIVYRDRGSW